MRVIIGVLAAFLLSACGGHGGNSSPPNNPAPTAATLSPSATPATGTAFTLTVTGTGFVSSSVVNWNGTALTTTFISSTQLTASVPANLIASVATAQVTVTNPTPGGGSSTQLPFAIVNPTPVLSSLSTTSAPVGSAPLSLAITGSKFVAGSVVRWNGVDRATTFNSATQVTATIPATDLVFAGSVAITVANPTPGGGSSTATTFTIQPQIANGTALSGAASALAVSATVDLFDNSASGNDIQGGVVMNRLDVVVAPNATVGQVNDALGSVGAGIVSMTAGLGNLTVGVRTQSSVAGLDAIAAHLRTSPGIDLAVVAYAPAVKSIFPGPGISFADMAAQVRHLLPARFPAAWNATRTGAFGDPANPGSTPVCAIGTAIPVLVADFFATPPDPSFTGLLPTFQGPAAPSPGLPADVLAHGYLSALTLGANGFGANPFPLTSGCVDLRLVQVIETGATPFEVNQNVAAHLPAGAKAIVNYSMGARDECVDANGASRDANGNPVPCAPPTGRLQPPLSRAAAAVDWKDRTGARWNDFLIVASAGNARDKESTTIYPGNGDSHYQSEVTLSQFADPQFQFITDNALWNPSAGFAAQGFSSLKASAADQADLAHIATSHLLTNAIADNVIVVGSATSQTNGSTLTQHVTQDQLAESTFSNSGPDVLAVGENVLDNPGFNGTSVAAPQVAGLASLLWMLSPDLHAQTPSITKRAIVANTRNRVIDAYASVLSLDDAALPTEQTAPIRTLLLDVNGNGHFTETDIEAFLRQLFVVDTGGNITRQAAAGTTADFSRYDLNGDGFTTAGARRERFDLDRVGSQRYGTTQYANISQSIEGTDIRFDESAVTDLEILCYYAYSGLFNGDTQARRNLLAGRCGLVITPATATVTVGQQVQFTAATPTNSSANWSASCGSVDSTGLYTAPGTAGQCTVRATDSANSNLSGTATVTVTASTDTWRADYAGNYTNTCRGLTFPGRPPPPPTVTNGSATATFTANNNQAVSATVVAPNDTFFKFGRIATLFGPAGNFEGDIDPGNSFTWTVTGSGSPAHLSLNVEEVGNNCTFVFDGNSTP
jgi:hypothetical protein